MADQRTDLRELLQHIDPRLLTYEQWTEVGMALKHEGYPVSDWDDWSRRDSGRYHTGECQKKWRSFRGSASPVTGGSIFQMAVDQGWQPVTGHELDWNDSIERDDDHVVVDTNWIEGKELFEPTKSEWHPARELTRYLDALFEPGENVGYVAQSWQTDKGKWVPQNKGHWKRTAGQLIEELSKCGDDIGAVIGDYNKEAGAWIRFNPLDGEGVRNENVSDFRYALVESDDMDLEKQNAIYRELELPIACLVYSGGKSLHAIVRIDAADYSEYRKRVDYLYDICAKNGILIDTQNRNPSRLSRMPGCERGEHKQYIVDTNIGKASWNEWKDWIEAINDNLPEVDSLASVWDNVPELAPCLIDGLLREGHKMLISGPSKAGKSFLLIELCISIAEGLKWLAWQCSRGKVMYVNLELDRASCLHRFKDVYTTMGVDPKNIQNIDIWNLRGKTIPMDKLAPKLIRRAQKKDYKAIIIDPIYKVITGDENSADQMAKFCNQFDLVCNELGCAVIYCHHHSKGAQGQKRAIDRSSGSGVFARDPDAVLDLIELGVSEALLKQEENKAVCSACAEYLKKYCSDWENDVSQDDMLSSSAMLGYCSNKLDKFRMNRLNQQIEEAKKHVRERTAWRIEGTLREFANFPPVNSWFQYPVHLLDDSGALQDIQPEKEMSGYEKMIREKKEKTRSDRADILSQIEVAFEGMEPDAQGGLVALTDIAEQIGVSLDTLKGWFGDGKKKRPEYKKKFEKIINVDGKSYLRRYRRT